MVVSNRRCLNFRLPGEIPDFPCNDRRHLLSAPLLSYSFSTHCLPSNGAQSIDPDDDAGLPQFRGQHKSKETTDGQWHREMVQLNQRLRLYRT